MTGPAEWEFSGTLRSGDRQLGARRAQGGGLMARRHRHLRLPAQHLRIRGDARRGRAAGSALERRRRLQHLRGDRRGRAPGAPGDPQGAPRATRQRRIIVTGCAAQTEPAAFAAMPEVDLVLGNEEKLKAAGLSRAARFRRQRRREGPRQRHHERHARPRAHLVDAHRGPRPRLRPGAERLRPSLHLLHHPLWPRQFALGADGRGGRAGAAAGRATAIAEIVLTGVDITSYGADLPGAPTLGKLVKPILRHVPELPRLRLSSIDSIEADDDLLDAHRRRAAADAASASVAAGRRRHDPEAHEAPPSAATMRSRFCAEAPRRCGPTSSSAPTSSPAFRPRPTRCSSNSLRIVEECGLTHLHVFPFSPRAGHAGGAHAAGAA